MRSLLKFPCHRVCRDISSLLYLHQDSFFKNDCRQRPHQGFDTISPWSMELFEVLLTEEKKRRISFWQNTCKNNKEHTILMSNLDRWMCLGHIWWSEGSGDWKCTAVRVWDATSGVTMATVSQERASWQSNLVKIINVGVCLCLIYVCARVLLSPGWWGETEFYLSRLSASVFIIITHKLKIKRIGTQLEGIYGIWLQRVAC